MPRVKEIFETFPNLGLKHLNFVIGKRNLPITSRFMLNIPIDVISVPGIFPKRKILDKPASGGQARMT